MAYYTVQVVETNVGYMNFNTEEEAQNWMECPEDFDGMTWTDSSIEGMKVTKIDPSSTKPKQ